jgi:hypothetical protein
MRLTQHIASVAHIKRQKFNIYSGYIRGLAKKFSKKSFSARENNAENELPKEAFINLEDSQSKPPEEEEEEEPSALSMLFEGIESENALLRKDVRGKK